MVMMAADSNSDQYCHYAARKTSFGISPSVRWAWV